MSEQLNQGMIMKALDFGYEKAVNGLPGLESAEQLARNFISEGNSVEKSASNLIRWQIAKASTSGFVTGLGGIITIPVAIPSNIASVLYIQLRMIAAIASMGENDIRNDQVKTLSYMCLCGSAITEIVKDVGIQVSEKLTASAINKISGSVITNINQAVGFRLLTKFGKTGAINLVKAIPFVSGVIGGTADGIATKAIGKVAINTFLGEA